MKNGPSLVQRRMAALAVALALLGLGYGALVRPILEAHRYYDERIGELRHQGERYARVARDRDALQRSLQERTRADLARQYYLAERNPALAAAELQNLVKRAVELGKGEALSTQVLSGQRERSEVTVRIQVRGDIRTLQRMLHALESARPLLFVGNLGVSLVAPGGRHMRMPGVSAGKDLMITMEVSAYVRERPT